MDENEKNKAGSHSKSSPEREVLVPRRTFLKSTVGGLAATTLAASGLANTALAHDFRGNKDRDHDDRDDRGDIKGHRILLKGGTILSMDPAVGDFIKGRRSHRWKQGSQRSTGA